MSVNLLTSHPEFSMCASLMVPNRGDNNLARSLAIRCVADPMQEIIGFRVVSDLWVLGRA